VWGRFAVEREERKEGKERIDGKEREEREGHWKTLGKLLIDFGPNL